jgi:hypothetical protein
MLCRSAGLSHQISPYPAMPADSKLESNIVSGCSSINTKAVRALVADMVENFVQAQMNYGGHGSISWSLMPINRLAHVITAVSKSGGRLTTRSITVDLSAGQW